MELQEVDRQLLDLERAKGSLPQYLEELKRNLENLNATLENQSGRLKTVQAERRSAEGALSLAKERKKKYENQLYSVKTNKEYDAITTEIENTEKEIDAYETKILESLDQEEQLTKEVQDLQSQIKVVEADMMVQQATLNQKMAQTKGQFDELKEQRHGLSQELQPGILRSYERIFRGKDGIAVVTVTRGACGGCNTLMPPQRIMEIREMKVIHYCENCGRILVWQEEEAAAVPA